MSNQDFISVASAVRFYSICMVNQDLSIGVIKPIQAHNVYWMNFQMTLENTES